MFSSVQQEPARSVARDEKKFRLQNPLKAIG